jgi:hypothetical protein
MLLDDAAAATTHEATATVATIAAVAIASGHGHKFELDGGCCSRELAPDVLARLMCTSANEGKDTAERCTLTTGNQLRDAADAAAAAASSHHWASFKSASRGATDAPL